MNNWAIRIHSEVEVPNPSGRQIDVTERLIGPFDSMEEAQDYIVEYLSDNMDDKYLHELEQPQ